MCVIVGEINYWLLGMQKYSAFGVFALVGYLAWSSEMRTVEHGVFLLWAWMTAATLCQLIIDTGILSIDSSQKSKDEGFSILDI